MDIFCDEKLPLHLFRACVDGNLNMAYIHTSGDTIPAKGPLFKTMVRSYSLLKHGK